MRIGYIGTGAMGGPLAQVLAREHEVLAYDRNPAVLAACARGSVRACADTASVVRACDTVLLCLPGLSQVEAFCNEVRDELRPGLLVVDQSTSDPVGFVDLAGRLAETGTVLADAPVSGGAAAVESGTLTVMVGAQADTFARIAAAIAPVTASPIHTGPVGSAMAIKVANNYLAAVQAAAAMQVFALAGKLGCDLGKTLEVLNRSSGDNYYLQRYMRSQVLEGEQTLNATIEVMQKDVALALRLADKAGIALAGRESLEGLIERCVDAYGKGASYHALAKAVSDETGVNLVNVIPHS